MAATTTTSAYTLPATPIAVSSTTGFSNPSGTLRIKTAANGVQAVTYMGISGNTFTGCSGGTGSVASGATVTQTAENGPVIAITLLNIPGKTPANGVFGIPSSNAGTYTFPLNSKVQDLGSDRGTSFLVTPRPVVSSGGGVVLTTYYLMHAYESGGSCTGNTLRTWVVTSSPDLTGALYTGPRCSPTPGTLSNFQVAAMWSQ